MLSCFLEYVVGLPLHKPYLNFFSLEEKKQKNKFANEVGTKGDFFRLRHPISRFVYRQAPVPGCVLALLLICSLLNAIIPFPSA